jgi:hypothetical protein
MDQLIQIGAIPPWHQSTEFLTSCPKLYVESVIKGRPQPGGMESARGQQVHATGAAIIAYCALHRVSSDLKKFDELAAGAGPLAARILNGWRDSLEVDYEHVLATEITLSLDAQFRPTNVPGAIKGMTLDSGEEAVIVGTLDGLYAFLEQALMRIDDLKTHPRPFEPEETLQAKTYALLVFLHFPWVEKVVFRLIFVRYRRVTREVEFTRDMIPALQAAVSSARDRQIKIHADYEAGREIEALAGSHCRYCPLLTNAKCPIAQWNPQMQMTMAQRLNFYLWYAEFSRANSAALRTYVQETGRPVMLKDYNGKAYVYGPVDKESEVYPIFRFTNAGMEVIEATGQPVLPIIGMLADYAHDNPGDSGWMKNVVIASTSLRKYLKTNKRSFLDQAIEDTCDKVTKVALRVSKPLENLPDDGYEDEDEFDEDGEILRPHSSERQTYPFGISR